MIVRPKTVKVGAHTYDVYWDEETWRSLDDIDNVVGKARHREQKLYIKPGQGPDEEANTFLHELLHAVMHMSPDVYNMRNVSDPEEYLVEAWAPWLLQVIRDNPVAMAYLAGRNMHLLAQAGGVL